jgi:ABC-type Fe3+/spermidine/putrescine transport system ATPase subunit
VLLLDEPLGALDRKLRQEMQIELKLLQSQLGITFVFVTHDQEEALSMSDRIAVMLDGHVEQLADPDLIYENPASAFVAGFIGQNNFMEGVFGADGELACEGVTVVSERDHPGVSGGQRGIAAVRPEAISISSEEPPPGPNRLAATLAGISHLGDVIQYVVIAAGRELLVRLPRHGAPRLNPGEPAWCTWPADLVQLFPYEQVGLVLAADPINDVIPAGA